MIGAVLGMLIIVGLVAVSAQGPWFFNHNYVSLP